MRAGPEPGRHRALEVRAAVIDGRLHSETLPAALACGGDPVSLHPTVPSVFFPSTFTITSETFLV